ncbi:T9SS type A sorting domain-containing protein [Flavobacterium sp. 9AF]|uniref:T9SS type A sorting domain-containing protein n=1 Tax=Flavobacterium sp. 9AF TaxID=2653142 RepID=UPI00135A5507|nr:T9SS type A sorting domain-containing protein [Flavobacterium sp. 9AF]
MKQTVFYWLLFISYLGFGQNYANSISFSYDNAGNQIKRELSFSIPRPMVVEEEPLSKTISEIKEEELLKFFPEDIISYYPNPVQEELFLKWELIDNNQVTKIEVYSFTGQQMKAISNLEKETTTTISFQEYPSGTYTILLFYSKGESQSITIIKP